MRKFGEAVMYCLCAIAYQLQDGLVSYTPLVDSITRILETQLELSCTFMKNLISQLSPPTTRISREQLADPAVFTSELSAWLSDSRPKSVNTVPAPTTTSTRLHVNQQNLRRAWEASQRSTKDGMHALYGYMI